MTTLFEKVWENHIVASSPDRPPLLYVDRHLVHEVTSPQAFDSLRKQGRGVRRPDLTFATADHNVPTDDLSAGIRDPVSRLQVQTLENNCRDFGIQYYGPGHERQGIVHVIGPELGLTLPGLTVVCGDSHTSTHGAFGALAFGIGTSAVEHVLATQCLPQEMPRTMEMRFSGRRGRAVTPKDLILAAIRRVGASGGAGHVIEYTGEAVRAMSMEQRMTVCNMSIECGARAGVIAPDERTVEYVRGRPFAPKGKDWDRALDAWAALRTDHGTMYGKSVELDASGVAPQVTWGTNPSQSVDVDGRIPDPEESPDGPVRESTKRALGYIDLEPGTRVRDIEVDRVFVGSCTNARLEDLRAAASILDGRKVARGVRAMVVPGSAAVRRSAEAEGIDRIFLSAGFEWRGPGCSMCLGMNPDVLAPGDRCASTSNRNFEGRQGRGGRTHLVSPLTAAATAVEGRFADPRDYVTGGER